MEMGDMVPTRIGVNRRPRSGPAVPKGGGAERPGLIVRLLDGIITFGIAALFFGFPIFFLGLTFQGLAFEKQIYFYFWLMVSLIAWAVKGVVLGEMKIKRTPLDIPIAIFWMANLLSTIFSVDKWHSFWGFFGDPSRGLMGLTAMILGYYLIISHLNEKRLRKMLGAFLAAGIVASLWIFLRLFDIKFLPVDILSLAPLSLTGSLSGLGTFLASLLPLAMTATFKIGMSEKLGKGLKTTLLALLASLIVLDMFLIFILSNFVSFPILLAGLVIFLIYILSMIVRPSGNLFWVPMAVFVLILTFWMIGPAVGGSIRIDLPVEVSPTYEMSWHVAKESLRSGIANFVLGSGPATYGYDFSLFRPQEFNSNRLYSLRFYQGTGMFFESLPTIGFLGTAALAVLLLTFVSFTIYYLSRDKEKNKIYSLGLLSASFIMLLNVVLGRAEGSVLILSALLGALASATILLEGDAEGRQFSLSLKASPKFALTLAFIFMMVSAGAVFLFVYLGKVVAADLLMGSAAKEKKVTEASLGHVSRALGLYGKEGRYYVQWGRMFMVLANEEMLKGEGGRDANKIQAYLNNSIKVSEAGSQLMKNDVSAVESLALAFENAATYFSNSPEFLDSAKREYGRSQELEPLNPHFYLKLGQIQEASALKEKDEAKKKESIGTARDLFRKAVELKKDFGPGYYNLALAQEALGDLDGAISNMSLAFKSDQQEINYQFNLARLLQARGKGEDNKMAEILFKRVLGVNDKEVNSHFYLALLYEKLEKKEEAIKEYRAVLDLLPADSRDTRDKIEEMVSNLQSGGDNVPSEEISDSPAQEEEAVPETGPEANQ